MALAPLLLDKVPLWGEEMARMRDMLTYYMRAPREDGSERGPGVGRILRVIGQHHDHVEREGEVWAATASSGGRHIWTQWSLKLT